FSLANPLIHALDLFALIGTLRVNRAISTPESMRISHFSGLSAQVHQVPPSRMNLSHSLVVPQRAQRDNPLRMQQSHSLELRAPPASGNLFHQWMSHRLVPRLPRPLGRLRHLAVMSAVAATLPWRSRANRRQAMRERLSRPWISRLLEPQAPVDKAQLS